MTAFLRGRLLCLVLLAEWLPVSIFVSTGRGGQAIARGLVTFGTLFATFSYLRAGKELASILTRSGREVVSARFFAAHTLAMLAFVGLSLMPRAGIILTLGWFGTGIAAIVLGAFAFIRLAVWGELLRATGRLWVAAALAACAVWELVPVLWNEVDYSRWKYASGITFELVRLLLRPLLSNVIADRATFELGTPRFSVIVAAPCSGWEGVGLAFLFGAIYLWLFRRECRFPQAFLVIPFGMATMFALNAVRLAVLILIGNAGAPGVALGGFHSQAGWIAFNAVALGLCIAVPRIAWFNKVQETAALRGDRLPANPAVPFLLPFAGILAAGMISRAASAGFEWLYPLRFLAAAGVLWAFRKTYQKLDWRPGWLAPIGGIAVFVLWILMDRGAHTTTAIESGLADLSPWARTAWISFRFLAAASTVPIAEELAFRGFLWRRLISPDFESVDPHRFTWLAFLGSSLAFGLMHGGRWAEGMLAGFVYGAVMRRSGIGSAVTAHATTNALLGVWVLIGGRWFLW